MAEFGLKGKITNMDFMIHIHNNVLEKYDAIPDKFENCVTLSGIDTLTILGEIE